MKELLAATDALRTLVRGCYGPCGEEVLVFTPPDPPVISAHGHSVLRAYKAREDATLKPFERVLLDAAEGVYQEAGDGSVQFILGLHSMLSYVAEQIDRHATSTQHTTIMRVQTARAVAVLRQQLAQEMMHPTSSWVVVEKIEGAPDMDGSTAAIRPSFLNRLRQTLTTTLTGMLGHHVVQYVVSLVMQWVFAQRPPAFPSRSPVDCWFKHIHAYIKHAPAMVIHAQGGSIMDSTVVPPGEFILRKSLIPSQTPSLLSRSHGIRFVCLLGALDLVHGSNAIKLDCGDNESMGHQALYGVRQVVLRFVSRLKTQFGVQLIVTSEKIEDYAAAMCSQLEVACVQYAEREDIEALCSVAGICPLGSVVDDISEGENVGVCNEEAISLRLNQTPSIRFRGLRKRHDASGAVSNSAAIPSQIILHATSKGVYKQYYNAIFKCLRVLRALFMNSMGRVNERCVLFCRGAGATELALARLLRRDEQKMMQEGTADVFSRLARQALANAMVESVVQLRTNVTQIAGAHPRDRCKSSRILLESMSFAASCDDQQIKGCVIDAMHCIPTLLGSINVPAIIDDADPLDYGVLHPWRRIDTIIHGMLQTAEMLLRVDGIVHVRRHPRLSDPRKMTTTSEDD